MNLYIKQGISKKTGKPYKMLCVNVDINGSPRRLVLNAKNTFLLYELIEQLIEAGQVQK